MSILDPLDVPSEETSFTLPLMTRSPPLGTHRHQGMLPEAVQDPYAHRVLLQLLAPDNRRYLPQAVIEMMHPAQRTVVGSSGKMVTDLDGDEDDVDEHLASDLLRGRAEEEEDDDGEELFAKAGSKKRADKKSSEGLKRKAKEIVKDTQEAADDDEAAAPSAGPRVLGLSKKDALLRRRELLGSGPASLSAALTRLVSEQAGSLIRSPHGCDVVAEVARGGDGGLCTSVCFSSETPAYIKCQPNTFLPHHLCLPPRPPGGSLPFWR